MFESPTTPSDIYPCLTYDSPRDAMHWLCRVFGFAQRLVVPGPGDSVMHSELTLGTGVIMISSPRPEMQRFGPQHAEGSSQTTSVFVADPEAHFTIAVAEEANIIHPLKHEDYNAVGYLAEDCEGHRWYFGNYRPGQFWDNQPS